MYDSSGDPSCPGAHLCGARRGGVTAIGQCQRSLGPAAYGRIRPMDAAAHSNGWCAALLSGRLRSRARGCTRVESQRGLAGIGPYIASVHNAYASSVYFRWSRGQTGRTADRWPYCSCMWTARVCASSARREPVLSTQRVAVAQQHVKQTSAVPCYKARCGPIGLQASSCAVYSALEQQPGGSGPLRVQCHLSTPLIRSPRILTFFTV